MPAPRDLADLPYAHLLRPHSEQLRRHGDYTTTHFDELELEDSDAGDARFDECALSTVAVTGGRFRGARFTDVWTRNTHWVGTDLSNTTWSNVELAANVLAGVAAFGSRLRGVVFHQCKFTSVNCREMRLCDVTFRDCVLHDVDWSGADLNKVSFPDTVLDDVRLAKATLNEVDLRDATALGITDGYDALSGAVISGEQLITLAPMLASTLGITVENR